MHTVPYISLWLGVSILLLAVCTFLTGCIINQAEDIYPEQAQEE